MNRNSALQKSTWCLLGLTTLSFFILMWSLGGPRPLPTSIGTARLSQLPHFPEITLPIIGAANEADPAWARPIFFADRKQHAVTFSDDDSLTGQAVNSPLEGTLTGIIRSRSVNVASLQRLGQTFPIHVRVGEEVPDSAGWKLVSLTSKSAKFRSGAETQLLELDAKKVTVPIAMAPHVPAPQMSYPARSAVSPYAAVTTAPDMRQSQLPPAKSYDESPDKALIQPPILEQKKQMDAVRQRIEAARKSMKNRPSSAHP